MEVRDIMSRMVATISAEDTVQDAARLMQRLDTGALPVAEGERLIGMVTDRDIVVRALARGKAADRTRVREIMTPEVKYIYVDESTEDVARNMCHLKVRRLPVLDRDKRLVGIVSLADLAVKQGGKATEWAIREVSQPPRLA